MADTTNTTTTLGPAVRMPERCIVAELRAPRADGDPICPMTKTTNCNGADARLCSAC